MAHGVRLSWCCLSVPVVFVCRPACLIRLCACVCVGVCMCVCLVLVVLVVSGASGVCTASARN